MHGIHPLDNLPRTTFWRGLDLRPAGVGIRLAVASNGHPISCLRTRY